MAPAEEPLWWTRRGMMITDQFVPGGSHRNWKWRRGRFELEGNGAFCIGTSVKPASPSNLDARPQPESSGRRANPGKVALNQNKSKDLQRPHSFITKPK